jgi:hypothetical protein
VVDVGREDGGGRKICEGYRWSIGADGVEMMIFLEGSARVFFEYDNYHLQRRGCHSTS